MPALVCLSANRGYRHVPSPKNLARKSHRLRHATLFYRPALSAAGVVRERCTTDERVGSHKYSKFMGIHLSCTSLAAAYVSSSRSKRIERRDEDNKRVVQS